MYLDKLLEDIDYTCVQGDIHTLVTELVYDSRKVVDGCIYVSIAGAIYDGHDFVDEAFDKGATAVVVEREVPYPVGMTVILVSDTRKALALMSAAYFDYPANKLTTIAVTGTKGKTTTTYMIRSILEDAGFRTGLIGTNEFIIGDETVPSDHSTPESYVVQQTFAKMVAAGLNCVVMEASSQGLMQRRLEGILFDYGIFTNIGVDHIGGNEHKDFEEYLSCKSMLFRQCRVGIFNKDDTHLDDILIGHTCSVETFGYDNGADLSAVDVRLLNRPGYLGISYRTEGLMELDVEVGIPGKFNVHNSLCAIALCRHFGITDEVIKASLSKIRVRGRGEMVPVSDKYTVILDYAHNAMSLKSFLTTLKEYKPKRLICLFGCGGGRSRDRRFEMGEISSNLADFTIVTSDNPRYEEPQDIVNDIITGVKRGPGKYIEILDRHEAIRYCLKNAMEDDVIVIAGKGHETYQEIKGVKYHMDDRELIRDAYEALLYDK